MIMSKSFEQFQQQIAYGNIYEVNYCIAFETEIHITIGLDYTRACIRSAKHLFRHL
jgi:anthranilate/para-aminobenzoate synthase component I